MMLAASSAVFSGCASGGYAGGVVPNLVASKVTIDAGQSFQIATTNPNSLPLTWALVGDACANNGCGTLTAGSNAGVTFTAPAQLSKQITLSLQATVTATQIVRTTAITVNPAPTISGNTPAGTVGAAYSAQLTAIGGTGTLAWNAATGNLPAGLSFNTTTGIISGTPTTVGTSSFTVSAIDQSDVPFTVSIAKQIVIAVGGATNALTIAGTPTAGTVGTAYTSTLTASGGTAPYSWSVLSGTLPAGLSLSTGGVISGTPTAAGTSSFAVQVKDAAGATANAQFSVTISAAPVTLTITSSSLPNGTVSVPYTASIGVSGGTAPYSCTIVSGALPAGLSFGAGCAVTGTPTTAGTSTPVIRVTDSTNPAASITGPVTIVIQPAAVTLTITSSSLPNGTVSVPYTATVGVGGGTAPYSCSIVSGALPAGLSFGAGCAVTGTPTIAGTSTPVIRVTDATNPIASITGPVTVVIQPAAVVISVSSPPPATAGTPYTGLIPVTGGTAPYACAITSGTLPAGLTLGANCQITGTPTTPGTTPVTVTATDSSSPEATGTGPVSIVVNAPTITLTLGVPPVATIYTPYTGTIPVTGGTAPYSCTIASGSLPAGLTLGANCAITGTPTAAGSSIVNVTTTDAASPASTKTGPVTITVQPLSPLTLTGSLPNATIGVAYTQTLHATGGLAPYTYAVTAGALPAGLSLATDGTITGTPTAVGASSFTITATDSEGTPQTASLPLVLLVTYQSSPNDALLKGPYAFLFQGYDDVLAGLLAYQTSTIGSFNADGLGVLTTGELDSNHQSSNPTGTTIASQSLLGTYTVGADGRGSIAVTTLNADGTTAATTTYAIALKLPTAPATAATSGSLIEFDGNLLAGTKGSGTLLAQTPAAMSAGLNGNYAFGLSGDTPCLPSCTLGLIAGPVASVGQFSASGGNITGTGDTNVASTNYANSTLGGSYVAADGNGRVQLSLTTSKLASVAYPTNFAVYMVDASHAFLMSTDKHSAYVLQSGTAQLQTQATFNSASLNAPFVGYENAAVNPGLVGTTLSNVLNLSSATIFRATGNGNGTCTTTNVDVGGLTGLVSSLTGLGSNVQLLNAVLGTYQSLGNSNCTVANNGRTVLNYPNPSTILSPVLNLLGLANDPPPARVAYLTAPNQGYFLETGYAGLGRFEAQTGAPFTTASLSGTYVYGTAPAGTLATINSSGSFTADGAGNATTTLDQNVGVGSINVLNLGTVGTATYSLTDAAAGRYVLGGTRVIYAITPGRYVLLETNALSTSPYISLLF